MLEGGLCRESERAIAVQYLQIYLPPLTREGTKLVELASGPAVSLGGKTIGQFQDWRFVEGDRKP